jgi:electron transport complex protein RnfE
MTHFENFKKGFIKENPAFALYLGLCPTLAITTTLNNALGMGVAVIVVLTLANTIVSMLRKVTPTDIRIPVYIVIIATLVTMVEMLMQAFTTELYVALGVFIPLIVVNCIILGRAEAFASKNKVLDSMIDGVGMGLAFTFSLIMLAVIRQLLATGGLNLVNPFNQAVLFDFTIIPIEYTISLFNQPAGAFITFAFIAAIFEAHNKKTTYKPDLKEVK